MKEITTVTESEAYSTEGRLNRAKRYSSLAKLLVDQGMIVIVCTISMFDEVRDWNRKNIRGYIEVFLDVSESILRKRDKKGLGYKIDMDMQLPRNPDLLIDNNGTTDIATIVKMIKNTEPLYKEDFDRDRVYWNQFYNSNNKMIEEPSSFAMEIVDYMTPGKEVLELGCGNGRDSLFFLEKGMRVVAIDASDVAIEHLNGITTGKNAMFVCDNFVKCQSIYQLIYDYIYSRFTLHAITEDQENELLHNIRSALCKDGLLFIEARTIHDDIYGKGEKIGHNAYYYNDHYRRFIDVKDFCDKLKKMGFEIVSVKEGKGLSKNAESDPVLMRCIARLSK